MSLPKISSLRGDQFKKSTHTYRYTRSDRPDLNFSFPFEQTDGIQVWTYPHSMPYSPVQGTTSLWRGSTPYGLGITKHETKDYVLNVDYGGGRVDSYSYSSGYLIDVQNGVGTWFNGRWPENPPSDVGQAITECLLKLADSKADMGTNIVQARQTASMFSVKALGFAKLLANAKRGRFLDRLWGYSDNAASALLQWDYGWKPLAQDIFTLVEEQIPKDFSKALIMTARRRVTSGDSFTWDIPVGDAYTRECQYKTLVQLTAAIDKTYGKSLARGANQWGLLNPASLAWEIVPWSFVVDWFMPVGNVLAALTATTGLDFVSGHLSRTAQGSIEVTRRTFPYPWNSEPSGPPTARTERFAFRREPYAGFPLPMPYFKNPFTSSHAIDAAALLRHLV